MTREESIYILKNTIVRFGRNNGKSAYVKALQVAIKALEEQQLEHSARCKYCDMAVCTLEDKPCSGKVKK